MRRIFAFTISFLSILNAQSQDTLIEGTIIVYYSLRIPSNWISPPKMYCLDSIRLKTNNDSYPILGDHVQHEYFLFAPLKTVQPYEYTNTFRNNKLYCVNPLYNYNHKGGELFFRECDTSKLYIAFNIKGIALDVRPTINSEKSDSLKYILEKSYYDFLEYEKTCPCDFFINDSRYLIFVDIYKTKPLSGKQKKKFGFRKSEMTEFLRYGNW